MAVFTFNEDGTIRYLDEHVPYNPFEEEYDSSRVGNPQSGQKQSVNSRIDFENMNSVAAVDAFISSFKDDGLVISKKTVKRYLPKVDASLKDYFLKEVDRHNSYSANHCR